MNARNCLFAAAWMLCSSLACAQAYPGRPVTLIVPFAPGGSVDIVARLVAARLAQRLGKPVVIDNVAGAGGVIGTAKAGVAPADGYTLLFAAESPMLIAKLVTPGTVKYDGLRDFTPISLVGTSPLVLVGKPELPARTASELVQMMRKEPGRFSYATSGIGSSLHLAGELINQVARVKMVHVPYRVGAQIVTDLAGNQIDLAVLPLVTAMQATHGGRARAYGVLDSRRWPTAPEIPALSDTPEFKGAEVSVWFGLFAPARTDPAILTRLAQEMTAVLQEDGIGKRMLELNVRPADLVLAGFGAFLQREQDKFAAIVKAVNIKAE
jgi:tripartite-type tricarboxylate transporter receptor subunit TctC